jgi:hypothetical protein
MSDFLTWGTLIAAGASLLAWVKFWVDLGSDRQRIKSAEAMATAAMARAELANAALGEFKERAAREFASNNDLIEAERRFADAVNALGSRFDRMADRLDRVLDSIGHASQAGQRS